MARIEAVIFDIGNVLIGWQPEAFYDRRIGRDRRRAFFRETGIEAINTRIDLGEGFRDLIYAHAADHPRWAEEIRLWHDNWIDMLTPVIDESVAALAALRSAGIPVFAMSNFGDPSFAQAEARFPFLQNFDRRYISARHGVIKPDPAFYGLVENDCGVAPDRLLFTDDRAENITAAAVRGWQTHHFDGAGGWVRRLVAEGLLPDPPVAK